MAMQRWVRVLALALLATFAVASVVHAASAVTMSLTMALVDHGALDRAAPDHAASDVDALHVAGCDACDPATDERGDRLACDALCLASPAANLGQDRVPPIRPREPLARFDIPGLAGRTGRPEPLPPRTLV